MSTRSIEAALEPLRQNRAQAAIYCDIDGTLSPITESASESVVPERTRELIERLVESYLQVACVSGRSALEARRLVGIDNLTYVGNHGFEWLEPGGAEPLVDPKVVAHADLARDYVMHLKSSELQEAGVRIEDKNSIWALHWRGASDEQRARAALDAVALGAERAGLATHWGRKILEIRPPVDVTKGSSLRKLVTGSGARFALFGGDDATDLDGFESLRKLVAAGALERAVCVGVESEEGPAEICESADLTVSGTLGFATVLDLLAAAPEPSSLPR